MELYLAVNYNGEEVASNCIISRYCDYIKQWNSIDIAKGCSKDELFDEDSEEYKYWTNESSNYNTEIYDGLDYYNTVIVLPKGTIEKLTGKQINWNDEPLMITSNV